MRIQIVTFYRLFFFVRQFDFILYYHVPPKFTVVKIPRYKFSAHRVLYYGIFFRIKHMDPGMPHSPVDHREQPAPAAAVYSSRYSFFCFPKKYHNHSDGLVLSSTRTISLSFSSEILTVFLLITPDGITVVLISLSYFPSKDFSFSLDSSVPIFSS